MTSSTILRGGGIAATARMGSSRFPGKTLTPFVDRPLLAWLIQRLQPLSIPLVIATTCLPIDNAIDNCATALQVPVFRGHESDVLLRLHHLMQAYKWNWLVRVSGDSPFIDPLIVKEALHIFETYKHTTQEMPDIVTNLYPQRMYAPGFSVEVISSVAMEKLIQMAPNDSPHYREHVTTFAYAHQEHFKIIPMTPPSIAFAQDVSFCIDTKDDLKKLEHVAAHVKDPLHASYLTWLEAYQNYCI